MKLVKVMQKLSLDIEQAGPDGDGYHGRDRYAKGNNKASASDGRTRTDRATMDSASGRLRHKARG